jgi:cytochrome b subunit of formate dehydrogenase
MNEKIVTKKVISLTLAFSFLVMSITGIMLYIVPKGKIAYWANWEMFGLTKNQYGDIHITSMLLFLVVTIWHIYYNWKPLMSYLKNSSK